MLKNSSPSVILLLTFLLVACGSRPDLAPDSPLPLASFTENGVSVDIALEMDGSVSIYLAATFTPEAGWHLYAMDIPGEGVDGLGRPTLLELTPASKMQAIGELMESVESEPMPDEPETLRIYPEGSVTLRLPVALPDGDGWVDDQVSISYMACSGFACRPPVVGKIIPVHVPGADSILP